MNDDTVVEEQFIDYKCPHCRGEISFPASTAGSLQECFNCTKPIILPASGGEARQIPLPISTAKLTLRKFRGEDWKGLLGLFSDDDFFEASPLKLDGEEQIVQWLEQDTATKLTSPGIPFTLAVETRDAAKLIGLVTFRFSDADRLQAMFQVIVHREHQRHGFGTEATVGLFGFCFQDLSLHRLQAECDSPNAAASRMLEKAGMRREGEFIADHKKGNQWVNTAAFAILRDEFKQRSGK